jgi:hypothetical protein
MRRASQAIVLGTLLLSALGVVLYCSTWHSDAAIKSQFLKHRAGFERLVTVAQEDVHVVRVAPDFTWLDNDYAWPRQNVGISTERWNEYRKLFRQVGVKDGLGKNFDPLRIFFPIVSAGMVPTSWTKGLVYSPMRLSPTVESLDEKIPDRFWDGTHVLVFKPIEDHWYIYYEE